jgi:hypothetical protein
MSRNQWSVRDVLSRLDSASDACEVDFYEDLLPDRSALGSVREGGRGGRGNPDEEDVEDLMV